MGRGLEILKYGIRDWDQDPDLWSTEFRDCSGTWSRSRPHPWFLRNISVNFSRTSRKQKSNEKPKDPQIKNETPAQVILEENVEISEIENQDIPEVVNNQNENNQKIIEKEIPKESPEEISCHDKVKVEKIGDRHLNEKFCVRIDYTDR